MPDQLGGNGGPLLKCTIRLLIVDDGPMFLEMEARFFIAIPRIEVVGRALSGFEAVEQAARLDPDLVIMDLSMPGMNGLEAASLIKRQPNPPRIIMLTMHDHPAYREISKGAGADGFVTKTDFGLPLLRLIDELFPPALAGAPRSAHNAKAGL